METITALVQETVIEALLTPATLLVVVVVNVVLLSGLGARLLDRWAIGNLSSLRCHQTVWPDRIPGRARSFSQARRRRSGRP